MIEEKERPLKFLFLVAIFIFVLNQVNASERPVLSEDAKRIIRQSESSQYADILAPLFRALQSYRLRNLVEYYLALEKAAKETPEKLKGAGSFLMKVFGVLAGKGPKRVGALYVMCQLFKIYFKLGTVHLCRSVIRSIETARIFDFEEFPVRDKVTYMYYAGRLEYNNVVLALKRGNLLKRGDLRLLRHALEEHEDRFLRSGVYLLLEKLELQVYQRLIKKMWSASFQF
ncbi:unnamed protein product [Fraxinus pennsylvanica]|uniref:Uncharacterized protein n=1 Tax=Fraxinus pennsylvanica TaxID=56036 RepID=A0AAD1Z891_9LAMI|nr:unnamed protein product [Fraxinus pennsylvanica]